LRDRKRKREVIIIEEKKKKGYRLSRLKKELTLNEDRK